MSASASAGTTPRTRPRVWKRGAEEEEQVQQVVASADNSNVDASSPASSLSALASSYGRWSEGSAAQIGSVVAGTNAPVSPARLALFDLLRLVTHMERIQGGPKERSEDRSSNVVNVDEYEEDAETVHQERADHLENLWGLLDPHDRTPELRRRIDHVVAMSSARRLPRKGGGGGSSQDNNNHEDDPVHRIFLSKRRGAAAANTTKTDGQALPDGGGRRTRATKMTPAAPEARTRPPRQGGGEGGEVVADLVGAGGAAEEGRAFGPHEPLSPRPPSEAPPPPTTEPTPPYRNPTSVQDLQKDQREQMEAAISMMASQLKRQTEAIHATLRTQNRNLGGMEDAAEANVDKVGQLARDVAEHVRKGWTRTFRTWAVLLAVAIAFVAACLVILMVPKRPGACLLFCPKKPSPAAPDTAICHDRPDGTQECVSLQEALARLYARQQDEEREAALDSATDGGDDELDRNEWGDPDQGHSSDGHDGGDRECQWDGRGGAEGECASGSMAAPAADESAHHKDAVVKSEAVDPGTVQPVDGPNSHQVEADMNAKQGGEDLPASSEEAHDTSLRAAGVGENEDADANTKAPHGDDEEHFDEGGDDNDDHEDDDDEEEDEAQSGDSAEDEVDSDWVRDSEDDSWQQVSVEADESVQVAALDGGEVEDDDDWDLPPIPDADDVLREYMENYHQVESSERVVTDDSNFEGTAAGGGEEEQVRDDESDSQTGGGKDDVEDDVEERYDTLDETGGDGPAEVPPIEPSTNGVAVLDGEPFAPQNVRHAAATGDVRLLEGYLRARPDWVNDADRNRWTGLHLAARAGHAGAVRLLLRYRADTSMQTVAGDTPFHIATQRLGGDHPVTLLLQPSDDPVERGSSGRRHDEL